jgi:heptosyltransferase-2
MVRSYDRIVVIRLSSLGDILLTTPALRALKQSNPNGELDVVVKTEYADLLKGNPNIDRIITVDTTTGLPGLINFSLKLRGRYDLVVDLHRSTRSFVMRYIIGAARILKYPKGVVGRTIMVWTGWKSIAMREEIPERYLKALAPLGIAGDDRGIDITIPATIRERIRSLLNEEISSTDSNGWPVRDKEMVDGEYSFFAIEPGARWATKRWLPERFAEVADSLADDHCLVPVMIGDRDERSISESVRNYMKSPVIDLTGRMNLLETGAVIERSKVLISNDSGLMHMASGLSTPIVAIFGPTTRELGFFPYRARYRVIESTLSCRPCHHLGGDRCPKGHHRCMTEVGAREVIEAATALLEPGGIPASKSTRS